MLDPPLEDGQFVRTDLFLILRRHVVLIVFWEEQADDGFAFFGFAREDGGLAAFAGEKHGRMGMDLEIALLFVGAVTANTF